jgi:hypothetical protein
VEPVTVARRERETPAAAGTARLERRRISRTSVIAEVIFPRRDFVLMEVGQPSKEI